MAPWLKLEIEALALSHDYTKIVIIHQTSFSTGATKKQQRCLFLTSHSEQQPIRAVDITQRCVCVCVSKTLPSITLKQRVCTHSWTYTDHLVCAHESHVCVTFSVLSEECVKPPPLCRSWTDCPALVKINKNKHVLITKFTNHTF